MASFLTRAAPRARGILSFQKRHGTSIPVILTQAFENRGEKGDVIEVKRGFARNFLIPRKYAVYATHANRLKNTVEGVPVVGSGVVEAAAARAALIVKLQALAATGISITAPASATGTLFAAVSRLEVKEILSSVGVEVEEGDVVFGTVKSLGTHQVTVGGVAIGLQIKGVNE
ncbi:ribosomal protein L9, N-terminal domain-containing protein [Ochromonadaceae sp. CCMP2298]|nr:ribosomal protein L9, N-terminal domain-containing protein [Ochromonadaceae sp. CCMP2298]|mmetsp:Transcript_7450/g.16580  ORF Transcript_7450/g.16580 Transcript_7450/m.16580 type:complete len:173 (+) Transcript_7450:88-606(+)